MDKPVMEIVISPWALVFLVALLLLESYSPVFFCKLMYGL